VFDIAVDPAKPKRVAELKGIKDSRQTGGPADAHRKMGIGNSLGNRAPGSSSANEASRAVTDCHDTACEVAAVGLEPTTRGL